MLRNNNLKDLVFFRIVPLIRHVVVSYLHRQFGTVSAEGRKGRKGRKKERKYHGLECLNS